MRHRLKTTLALLALAIGFSSLALADEATTPAFTLAIVRQDGVIVPFATWNGKDWSNTWPVPAKSVDTPITLDGIPRRWWSDAGPVGMWHVREVDGSRIEVKTTAPVWLPVPCQQAIGLRTSLPRRGPVPPLRVQPYPKIGVAASQPLELGPIEIVGSKAPIVAQLADRLRDLVLVQEDTEVALLSESGWRHPYEPAARRAVPLRIEALYRTPLDSGGFVYFFEAAKRYAPRDAASRREKTTPGAAEPCEVATFVSGWFEAGATEAQLPRTPGKGAGTSVPAISGLTPSTRVTSCDYESVDVMLPLASLTLNGRRLWIGQLSGWDREQYQVIDPQGAVGEKVQWAAPGGRCAGKR